jgi:hypothetical protein
LMPESGKPDMNTSSKARGLAGQEQPPARNETCRYTIFQRRALRSWHEAMSLGTLRAFIDLCHSRLEPSSGRRHGTDPAPDPLAFRLAGATE